MIYRSEGSRIIQWEQDAENIGKAVCAIGAFDGVHIGHRFLIDRMEEDAVKRASASVIVTFDRDPDELFCPPEKIRPILSNSDRIEMLSGLGADYVLVFPFTREFASQTFDVFLEEYLMSVMDLACIHVGCDFKFGAGNAGNVESITEWGRTHGCDCKGYDLRRIDGVVVSATRIRDLLAEGDVETAAQLLGKAFYMDGMVEHGRGEGGKDFGIPTANVAPAINYTKLKDGVYAGYVTVDGTRYPAAINVGIPPTFSQAHHVLEPHLLDFDGDLYGKQVRVSFVKRLRDLMVFKSAEELQRTVGDNIEWVREHLA